MKKVHEKSIVLGIGIGMIITAISGMIFSAGTNKELSKSEIISLAKGYGLIEQVKFINDENASNNSGNASVNSTTDESTVADSTTDESTVADSTKDESTIANSTVAETTTDVHSSEKNIIIEIKAGHTSQYVIDELLEKGVIESKEDFIAVLDFYKASTKINIGTFKFKKNEELHYIVKTICKLK
ncbi:MAG TPA: ABC transporter substrate-binding protein [Ruminiclostridium sp.]